MTLKVIGPGFGRTGTMSLKQALEQLGFGPCHHMEEVFGNPAQVPYWQTVAAKGHADWAKVFAGFESQVDWPGAHVWRELASAYPDAKVVLSVRPEEAWWKSFSATIGKFMSEYEAMPLPPHVRAMCEAANEMICRQTFNNAWTDREVAVAAYRKRIADVRAVIPAGRLLVFDVAEGWAPLCRFLGVPTPDSPFPHANTTAQFWEIFAGPPAR
ncbi:MAG TPA: sulfotransferase [Hyphomonadaceae bacterium]|nr:sulfotransferase [Hyphomonadaceae bacterium]